MDVKKEVKQASVLTKSVKAIIQRIPPSFFLYPANFATAYLLSRGIVLGAASPFGLAASAVLSKKRGAVFGLIGAALGYLSILDYINSLKYIACIILIFTAHFVFSDTILSKNRVFSPIAVIVPATCINLVFLADAAFPLFDSALAVFEVSLAAICTVLFSYVTERRSGSTRFSVGLLALCAALTVPLCDFFLFDMLSLGRTLSFALVLLCAHSGGIGAGAMTGIVLGFSVSMAESSADFCMLYGILGIMSAVFSARNKLLSCAIAALFTLFISVCLNPASLIPMSLELTLACAIFLPCTNVFSRYTRRFFVKASSRRDAHIRAYATERLNLAANAFRSLSKLLTDAKQRTATGASLSEKSIFERTSREICKKCTLAEICWKRDFEATRDAINNAQDAINKNGALSAKDFPIHFSSRCLHIENFVNTVNREIFAARYRRQFDGRLRESHELLTKQYSDASAIFSSISSDISENAHFDEESEINLRDLLASHGILCDPAVYRDSSNHINIHICGKDLRQIANASSSFLPKISEIVGTSLSAPQYTHGDKLDDIIIREKPKLCGVFGAAVKQRRGSDISGDSGSFFRPANGKLALLLSDGMGSGKLAARESAVSVTLLEDLLRAGISPQSALETLQAALTLKSEYTGAFATLDLMYADMFTGACEFYKFGGAPTYIKRGRQIRRITSSSLPAGMTTGSPTAPDRTYLTLSEGDFVVMISDGISDGTDDTKLVEFLSQSDEASPKALADSLFAYSLSAFGKNDDMTVAVVQILREE